MQIEFENCDIEISYIGTRVEIMLFMVGDTIEDFMENGIKPLPACIFINTFSTPKGIGFLGSV